MGRASLTAWRETMLRVPKYVPWALSSTGANPSGLLKESPLGVYQSALRWLSRSSPGSVDPCVLRCNDRGNGTSRPQSLIRLAPSWRRIAGNTSILRSSTRVTLRRLDSCVRWMSNMPEGDFHAVADEELEGIQDTVEGALEGGFDGEFDCNLSVSTRRPSRLQGIPSVLISQRLSCPSSVTRFPFMNICRCDSLINILCSVSVYSISEDPVTHLVTANWLLPRGH